MTKTVLITGASNGIGLELAKIHAEKGHNLVVVARSEDKLNALKQQLENAYSISVEVIARDLSLPESAQQVFNYTQAKELQIDTLINNAGFGGHGITDHELVDEQY
ncbi:SDR family NAD(P)-dependent oxidoreductase [Vibrio fortis]|uniref:SDR family NAD(P)-dependent oxidoreductase n=1 Tax=Vibrio fortis TaxID=212667 RepID=UPI0040681672